MNKAIKISMLSAIISLTACNGNNNSITPNSTSTGDNSSQEVTMRIPDISTIFNKDMPIHGLTRSKKEITYFTKDKDRVIFEVLNGNAPFADKLFSDKYSEPAISQADDYSVTAVMRSGSSELQFLATHTEDNILFETGDVVVTYIEYLVTKTLDNNINTVEVYVKYYNKSDQEEQYASASIPSRIFYSNRVLQKKETNMSLNDITLKLNDYINNSVTKEYLNRVKQKIEPIAKDPNGPIANVLNKYCYFTESNETKANLVFTPFDYSNSHEEAYKSSVFHFAPNETLNETITVKDPAREGLKDLTVKVTIGQGYALTYSESNIIKSFNLYIFIQATNSKLHYSDYIYTFNIDC